MALRQLYTPFLPELGPFLFAPVADGGQLTVLSALSQLGLDPWDEAARLSGLSRPAALDALAELIMRFPDASRTLPMARDIAAALVALLPAVASAGPSRQAASGRNGQFRFWIPALLLILALAGGAFFLRSLNSVDMSGNGVRSQNSAPRD